MNRHGILIQGAMDIELCVLLENLREKKKEEYLGFSFWTGYLGEWPIVLSQTGMGIINAVQATMAGCQKYQPLFVLNQGTAGGHIDEIQTGDLVIVASAEYLNGFRMPVKEEGEGSDALEWVFDEKMKSVYADERLVQTLQKTPYSRGKVYTGCIGSGDIYSREADRIKWIQKQKNNLCEDMETYAVFDTCNRMKVPCIGARIISNHEVRKEPFSKETALWLQEHIMKLLSDTKEWGVK